jgi:hypothetical protein
MKKVILFALVLVVCGALLTPALAQETPRYVVTYIRSQTGEGIRSATVVTVVNQSSTGCVVEVAWFRELTPLLGTSQLFIESGQAFQFCSRFLPDSITRCDSVSSPELNSDTPVQGKAIVSSSEGFDCSLLGVEARVYYTTGKHDTAISAISNSKIVFAGEGNLGD